ncbi:MAG TPA: ribonuclease III [Bacteroidota bacterium]|jgi:ribonuclease-3
MAVLRHLLRWIGFSGRVSGADTPDSRVDYRGLERILGYSIRDRRLFFQALSHRSFLQVSGYENTPSNERLEFLGDAVLNLAAAVYLYRHHAGAAEGELTKIRSRLVNRKALGVYARQLHLADFILMSPSAFQVAEKGMETILADAYEAIIGAIYLDRGSDHASRFVERTILKALEEGLVRTEDENFKSQLLEQAQAGSLGVPRYITVTEVGPDHDRTFTVEVFIGKTSYGSGTGKNKKDAEQAAAEKALQQLNPP